MILIDWTIIEQLWRTREGKFILIFAILAILFLIYMTTSRKRDWLEDAQKRQQTRFDYLNGKPQNTSRAEQKARNKQKDGSNGNRKWYPTGWTFNEKTQLWEPPSYINDEAHARWEWDDKKQIWIDTQKRQRMERYKKFREGR